MEAGDESRQSGPGVHIPSHYTVRWPESASVTRTQREMIPKNLPAGLGDLEVQFSLVLK